MSASTSSSPSISGCNPGPFYLAGNNNPAAPQDGYAVDSNGQPYDNTWSSTGTGTVSNTWPQTAPIPKELQTIMLKSGFHKRQNGKMYLKLTAEVEVNPEDLNLYDTSLKSTLLNYVKRLKKTLDEKLTARAVLVSLVNKDK